ncbi:hypothetical protein GCM10023097_07500 [Streptomyces collinus]|uniref:Uncharacterized protein n=1 Tax=Streptomyces collinus TaxID=42684 RepID=A0AA89QKV8_STRCU|nr:hypothetical protein [Streptomyces collinus]
MRTLAKHLHDFADDVSDALRLVKGMAGKGTLLEWAGKSADVFKGTSRMSRRTRMSSPSGRWVTEVL